MEPRVIPSPGKPGGPHDYPCGHIECHDKFQTAVSVCHKCSRPIGFDIEFDHDDAGRLQHIVCPGEVAQ